MRVHYDFRFGIRDVILYVLCDKPYLGIIDYIASSKRIYEVSSCQHNRSHHGMHTLVTCIYTVDIIWYYVPVAPWTKSTIFFLQDKRRQDPGMAAMLWVSFFWHTLGKFNSWLTYRRNQVKSKKHQFLEYGPQAYIFIHGSLKHFRVGNSWVTLATWSNNKIVQDLQLLPERPTWACKALCKCRWYHLRIFQMKGSLKCPHEKAQKLFEFITFRSKFHDPQLPLVILIAWGSCFTGTRPCHGGDPMVTCCCKHLGCPYGFIMAPCTCCRDGRMESCESYWYVVL